MTKLTLPLSPHAGDFKQAERCLERSANPGNRGYPPLTSNPNLRRACLPDHAAVQVSPRLICPSLFETANCHPGQTNKRDSKSVFLHRRTQAPVPASSCWQDGVEVRGPHETGLLHVDLTSRNRNSCSDNQHSKGETFLGKKIYREKKE